MNFLLGMSNGDLAITAVITGLGLVFAALLIARLISPRSFSFSCSTSKPSSSIPGLWFAARLVRTALSA